MDLSKTFDSIPDDLVIAKKLQDRGFKIIYDDFDSDHKSLLKQFRKMLGEKTSNFRHINF